MENNQDKIKLERKLAWAERIKQLLEEKKIVIDNNMPDYHNDPEFRRRGSEMKAFIMAHPPSWLKIIDGELVYVPEE